MVCVLLGVRDFGVVNTVLSATADIMKPHVPNSMCLSLPVWACTTLVLPACLPSKGERLTHSSPNVTHTATQHAPSRHYRAVFAAADENGDGAPCLPATHTHVHTNTHLHPPNHHSNHTGLCLPLLTKMVTVPWTCVSSPRCCSSWASH